MEIEISNLANKKVIQWYAFKFRKWFIISIRSDGRNGNDSFISDETLWTISYFFMATYFTLPRKNHSFLCRWQIFSVHSTYVVLAFPCSTRINNTTYQYNLCKAYSFAVKNLLRCSRRLTFAQQSVSVESKSDMTLAFRRKSKQKQKLSSELASFFIFCMLCRHCQDICVLFFVYKRRAVPLVSSSLATFHPAPEDLAISGSPLRTFAAHSRP